MDACKRGAVATILAIFLFCSLATAAESATSRRCREAAGFLPDGQLATLVAERSAVADCRSAMQSDPDNVDLPAYLGRALYLSKQYDESVLQVSEAARRGSVLGWVLTGVQYQYGYGRTMDRAAALTWYRRASDAGHPMGHLKVAELLIETASSAEQKAEAVAYLRKALDAHATGAEFYLGVALEQGRILPKNLRDAIEAYTRGAASNEPWSMTRLGEMHLGAIGVPLDARKAAQLFARAAALNDSRAQTALANLYLKGMGVDKDLTQAIRLYKQAAAEDDTTAASMLGFMYRGGMGIPADPAQAVVWLTQAAEGGNVSAQSQLGTMYADGDGIPRDMTQAVRFHKLAAAQGYAGSRHALGNIYSMGTGVPANQKEATRWYQLAAQAYYAAASKGDAKAQYTLGELYFGGFGVPEDEVTACRWWQKAAAQHIGDAHLRLAQCHGAGGALALDLAESARQLDLAARSPLPPVNVLAGISQFIVGAAKTGNNTGLPEVSKLARLAIDRLARDKTLLAEDSVESVMSMASAASMVSDYSLGIYSLKALDQAFLASQASGNDTDAVVTSYMMSYFLMATGDETAARLYLDKANNSAMALDRAKPLPDERGRRLMGGAAIGVYFTRMLELDDEKPRRVLAYALGKQGKDQSPELIEAVAKLMRAPRADTEKAALDMIQLMSQLKETADAPGVRNNMTLIASMHQMRFDAPPEEIRAQLAALALRASMPGMMEDVRLAIYLELAKRLEDGGQLNQAVYFGKLAVAASEKMRSQFKPDEQSLQEKFVTARAESYRVTAALLAKAGRFAESEEVLRLLRFDELRQSLRQTDLGAAPSGGMKAVCVGRECQTYRDQLALIEKYVLTLSRLRELLAAEAPKADDIDAVVREQARLANTWREGIAALTANLPETDEQSLPIQLAALDKQSQPFSSILSELGPGAVAIRYIVRKESLLIMVSMGGANLPTLTEVKIPETELNKLVGDLRTAINGQKSDVLVAAKALYDVILAPVVPLVDAASGMGARTVVMIAPDKALEIVPFPALFDGRSYVVQRWATTTFNDASTANLKADPGRPRLHGFGVTQAVGKNTALLYVGDELSKIAALVQSEPAVLDAAFTREKLYQAFNTYQHARGRTAIIHIASHFNLQTSSQQGQDSALVLGDGTPLSLAVIGTWPMSNTELLTLSACSTAVSPDSANGEHVQSFALIAQNKGARAVLATLWPVNDPSASLFMERFYRYGFSAGAAPLSKARALQQAQLDFLRPDTKTPAWRHPYYWAAYTLLGNWK